MGTRPTRLDAADDPSRPGDALTRPRTRPSTGGPATSTERRASPAGWLLIIGAVLQLAVPIFTGPGIGTTSDDNPSFITPSFWAFTVWNLIFLLAIAWVGYRSWPGSRTSGVGRRTDGWLAGAFLANAGWEFLFPNGRFVLAQILITVLLVCLAMAFAIVVHGQDRLTTVERRLLVPFVAIFLGWLTAATFVGGMATLVALDVIGSATVANTAISLGALFVCVLVATLVILFGSFGPPQGYLLYGATVIWALCGIVTNQFGASLTTTVASTGAIVFLALIVTRRWRLRREPEFWRGVA